eukprot:TRINITY_DN2262_c0_g2_i1.p1 TRINITY_DN2262_c0_g2~~TRINITY_DN2262_c0_g2_i1.p1  ORF type:complete len:197 (-),score=26.94 TRINITY_DN2262_c0_g2_i1:61-651(-)
MAGAFCMTSLAASLPNVGCSTRAAVSQRQISSACGVRYTAKPLAFQNFAGLRRENSLGLKTEAPFNSIVSLTSNGSRCFAMRHGKKIARLGRPADQRRALVRALTTELLRHGRIKTTQTKARAMRKYVDHMITLAKLGTLHHRRQALGFIYDKNLVHSLFAEVPERYAERNGGYTRIIRTMPRRGDNAPMAFIELV